MCIVQQWVPAYRDPFFVELKRLGASSGIDYQILAGDPPRSLASRGDKVPHNSGYRHAKVFSISAWGREVTYQLLGKEIRSADLVICEHAIRNINALVWSFIRKPKALAMWGHGRTYTKPTSGIEARLKVRLLKNLDWYFAYTQSGADFVSSHGLSQFRISPIINSTDTNGLRRECEAITAVEIEQFKSHLKIGDGPIGVFIGALDSSKRFDFLITSAQMICAQIPNFQLLVFGDGPLRSEVENIAQREHFITYAGRANIRTKALLSHIAGVILMPGRVGLIAVDSFAMGLPIATTAWDFHAPEFEYLENRRNAVISKNDVHDYSNSVVEILQDPVALGELKRVCSEEVSNYSIEAMAQNFHQGVLAALANSKRSIRRSFMGLTFSQRGKEDALRHYMNPQVGGGRAVHLVNSYTISQAYSAPDLLKILQEDELLCDGTPLAKFLSKREGAISPTRGPDFMRELLARSTPEMKHYFLGSTQETLNALICNSKMENSEIEIVGSHSPKMSMGFSDEIDGSMDLIRNSGATHVWVGLGTPKQDYVVHELAKHIGATFFAVGAAFDFLAGTVKEAPPIMRNSGFEWFYRFIREPKRLWRRYLVGNLKFLMICLWEALKFKRKPE